MTRHPIRAAVVAFLVSRCVFFALLLVTSQISFLRKTYSNSIWETQIHLSAQRVRPTLESMVMVGDAWWYRSIAINGYGPQPDRAPNWGFFPLFPLIVRYIGGANKFAFVGLFLANVSCLAAFIMFAVLAIRAGFPEEDAVRAVWYMALFPSSYFLSLPLTEALYLLLSIASFWGAFTRRWWLAGLAGGLASATRISGALLLLPLGVHALSHRERRPSTYAWLACVPVGALTFFGYLRYRTGDFLAYVHSQAAWGHAATWPWQPLFDQLSAPGVIGEPWNLRVLNFSAFVLVLASGVAFMIRRQFALGTYALAAALLPLCTGSLTSGARYMAVVFPIHLWLAMIGRRPLFDRSWLATSALLFGWLAALFALRVDFALA